MLVNPTGKFVLGGPHADTGLTGRKIIVDTYGGAARHGGGAFSGKDPSKVDRSAAYAARWVAKHVVAAGAARKCEVQVAYAIGVADPVSLMVETFGTESSTWQDQKVVQEVFDLRPAAIMHDLDLRRPIYRETAAYGHFGRTRRGLHVGGHAPPRRSEVCAGSLTDDEPQSRVVRVLPDVAAVDRVFDYEVPPKFDAAVRVGSIVRVDLHGRRVRGWVMAEGAGAPEVAPKPIAGSAASARRPRCSTWPAGRRGVGPDRAAAFLGTASPPVNVTGLPSAGRVAATAGEVSEQWAAQALARPRTVLRLAPAVDPGRWSLAAAGRGPRSSSCRRWRAPPAGAPTA